MSGDRGDEEFVLEPVRRATVFEALLTEPRTRSDLQEKVGVSRATLHRIVKFLEDTDLAQETDDGIVLTSLGQVVAQAVTEYVDRVTEARRLSPLLNLVNLSSDHFELDLSLLADTTVTLPQPGQPQRPAHRVVELVEDAEWAWGFGPVVLPIYVDVFHRKILDGMHTRLVVEPDVITGLEQSYAEKFTEASETGNLEMRIHDDLPFGLLITHDAVAIIGYDEDGFIRVIVDGDRDRLQTWADDVFESYFDNARAL